MTEIIDWNALHLKSVESAYDADMVNDIFESSLNAIQSIIDAENDALRDGKIEDALAYLNVKQTTAVDYARATDLMRRNLIAITRFTPDRLQALKSRQIELMSKLNDNAKLVSTLRSLSENLLRGVAQEAGAKTTLSTYGQNGRANRPGVRAPSNSIIMSTST